jgi:hypothetical protein
VASMYRSNGLASGKARVTRPLLRDQRQTLRPLPPRQERRPDRPQRRRHPRHRQRKRHALRGARRLVRARPRPLPRPHQRRPGRKPSRPKGPATLGQSRMGVDPQRRARRKPTLAQVGRPIRRHPVHPVWPSDSRVVQRIRRSAPSRRARSAGKLRAHRSSCTRVSGTTRSAIRTRSEPLAVLALVRPSHRPPDQSCNARQPTRRGRRPAHGGHCARPDDW